MRTPVLRSKTCFTFNNFGLHQNRTSDHIRTFPPEPHLISVTFDSLLSPLVEESSRSPPHFVDNFRFALPCFIQHNGVNPLSELRFGMHVAFDIQRWHESGNVTDIMAVLS
jgi:hypothetical protein